MKGKYHEEKLTRLEETRKSALEMAQEEDEKKKESSEVTQEVIPAGYQGSIG
ncbi:MAG: hypothetical protein LBJ20_00460 [Candidatus Methanoplasma sp.]|nr:hypothetical protein [Candidatus Methanoplasma sp.]